MTQSPRRVVPAGENMREREPTGGNRAWLPQPIRAVE